MIGERLKFVGSYILGSTLGVGATGKVKVAHHSKTGEKVGVKIIRKDLFYDKPSLRIKIQREISIMKLMFHPHVIKIFDVLEDSRYLYLIIEYASKGELFNHLVEKRRLDNKEALKFFQQLISGIDYCHKHRICHRDLKLENILLDDNYHIKIADFGMASLSIPNSMLKTFCGSPHYASPEVVSNEPYNGIKADVWSCGVILFALMTGKLPFDEENDNIRKLFNKIRFEPAKIPKYIPSGCRELLRSILTTDPLKRIDIEGIKNHKWFKSIPLLETCRMPVQNFDFSNLQNPILNPDQEIVNFLLPLQLVKDRKTLFGVLSSKKPSLIRVLYRQLEWRRMKMESLRNERIQEAVDRRKNLMTMGRRISTSDLEIWRKNIGQRCSTLNKAILRPSYRVQF